MDGIGDGGSAAKLARKRLDQDIVTGGASCPCPTPGNMLGTNELDRPNRGGQGRPANISQPYPHIYDCMLDDDHQAQPGSLVAIRNTTAVALRCVQQLSPYLPSLCCCAVRRRRSCHLCCFFTAHETYVSCPGSIRTYLPMPRT